MKEFNKGNLTYIFLIGLINAYTLKDLDRDKLFNSRLDFSDMDELVSFLYSGYKDEDIEFIWSDDGCPSHIKFASTFTGNPLGCVPDSFITHVYEKLKLLLK